MTTDLITAKTVGFHEGELIPTVTEYSAYPIFFTPIPFKHYLFAKGGILKPIPCDIAKASSGSQAIIVAVNIIADITKKYLRIYLKLQNEVLKLATISMSKRV